MEFKKSENHKNDVILKSIFGATKDALFRTAQNIIDCHEKKAVLKNKMDLQDSKPCSEQANAKNVTANMGNVCTKAIHVASLSGQFSCRVNGQDVVNCLTNQHTSIPLIERGSRGLLRFFESSVFSIHFAMHYLFYSKEPGVLSFIGNKIFSFPDYEVDLYVPQLIIMYFQMEELAVVLDPYLTYRCRKSVDFTLKCLWLMEAYNYHIEVRPILLANARQRLALVKELYCKTEKQNKKNEENLLLLNKKTHHRSQSDASGILSKQFGNQGSDTSKYCLSPVNNIRLALGDLASGKAFDNGCTCFETVRGTKNGLLGQLTFCICGAPKLSPEKELMKSLINIGRKLTALPNKTEKMSALRIFLNLINKNLPARVWLPLHSDIPHHIVRITEEKTAVLNSKDKTPYIIYVEVVEVVDMYSSPVMAKLMPTLRHTKSVENLEYKKSIFTDIHENNVDNYKVADVCHSKMLTIVSENNCETELYEINGVDDIWSKEDDDITAQYLKLFRKVDKDTLSQISIESFELKEQNISSYFNIGDVRTRHLKNLTNEFLKPFRNDPEDPSAAALKEPWHQKEKLIRNSSPYGHLPNWRLLSAIVKCGDDLRQELMATQLLEMFKIIWLEENVDLWVRPYKIVCLSDDSGLIEPIPNTVSVHQIKKNSNKSLREYFIDEYGEPASAKFKAAQVNFVQSCAAYCLISYLLQIKDRHNGNILLHSDGHIIHIDFGFILNISPKNLGFEQSPFKLTMEFVEVMGGTESCHWTDFNNLLLKGLKAARKHMDRIINLVEIMRSNSQLPCFKNSCSNSVHNLRKRFHMNLTEAELERKVEQLVQQSLKSISTKLYDGYQYLTNGIL